MTRRAAIAAALLVGLAGPAAGGEEPGRTGMTPHGATAAQPPLVITMPDTQPVLPSGMVELGPAQGASTGDANRLEPNIGGPPWGPAWRSR